MSLSLISMVIFLHICGGKICNFLAYNICFARSGKQHDTSCNKEGRAVKSKFSAVQTKFTQNSMRSLSSLLL